MAADLIEELRVLLVQSLRLNRDPHTIDPDAALFGGELGLDSLDAVQLVSAVERRFSVQITDGDLATSALDSLSGIARLLRQKGLG